MASFDVFRLSNFSLKDLQTNRQTGLITNVTYRDACLIYMYFIFYNTYLLYIKVNSTSFDSNLNSQLNLVCIAACWVHVYIRELKRSELLNSELAKSAVERNTCGIIEGPWWISPGAPKSLQIRAGDGDAFNETLCLCIQSGSTWKIDSEGR